MATLSSPFEPIPLYLSQSEVARFFAVITDPRDRALFGLIYFYGLRVSEIALLLRRDVDFELRRITIKRVKRGYWGVRPLLSAAADLLNTYLAPLYLLPDASLFPGREAGLKKRQIQYRFASYKAQAGLPSWARSHSLRHSIATHIRDAGQDIDFVREHLGQRRLASAAWYGRISDPHRTAIFAQLEDSPWIVRPEASIAHAPADQSKEA